MESVFKRAHSDANRRINGRTEMPEPYRTILEILLTALFGLNLFVVRGFAKRAEDLEKKLTEHEQDQAEAMGSVEREMNALKSNYVDRFSEVNANIFNLERKMLEAMSEINVSIAKIQERRRR